MNPNRWIPCVSALGLALAGCGGGSDNSINDGASNDDGTPDSVRQVVLDASSDTVYLNLGSGTTVSEGEDWHLAFNRYSVLVNGGVSGSGKVAGAIGDPQDDFYDDSGNPDASALMNTNAEAELEHLKDVFPEPEKWQEDGDVLAFGDDWSVYDSATGNITQVDGIGYLVRSGSGDSYARMRVNNFDFPTREGNGIRDFELEFWVQAAGSVQLSPTSISFTPPEDYDGGDTCFDFDTNAGVACSGTDWDVMVGFSGYDWYLKTNSGPSGPGNGGALGPLDWTELSAYTSATIDSSGASLAMAYAADTTGGVFTDYSWYEYNLGGAHKLWPNYRVYLINADSDDDSSPVYGVQVINYYGDNGTSGQPVVRWKTVTLDTEE